MKKRLTVLFGLVLFCSHDMYLKMDTYFVGPNQQATIHLYNGTFDKSDNVIDRDRMLEASISGNGNSYDITEDQWSEKDSVTILSFKTGDSGTWVAGVSTKPRTIEMKAEDFNDYLEHDGVLDMLEQRRENNALDEDAVEEYSKHVKAIFQVGDKTTTDWNTNLGYPIEFIPLANPYEKRTGDELQVKLLLKGKPLADQLVYADFKATEHGHTHGEDAEGHSHSPATDGGTHSHADGEEHEHPHEKADSADHTHSHADGEQHEHPHVKADSEEHTQSHAGDGEHGHSHKADRGENHSHSHTTHTGDGEHGYSHEAAAEENHSHSHSNAEEHEHDHEHKNEPEVKRSTEDHQHTTGQQLRTDQNGLITVPLSADGIWYLRTIHLANTEKVGLTHESNWATLTFEVVHGHGSEEAGHVHAEEDEFPSYVFWIGSLVVFGGLFFWFRRNK